MPSSSSRPGFLRLALGGALLLAVAGCTGDRTSSASPAGHVSLPAALGSRWMPPEFATRPVDGERAAVLDACVNAANSLGFSVSRLDGALGKISAARRQTSGFDGARQDTLEISVTTVGPGVAVVALVLREEVEPASRDERSGGIVTTSLVRDRAPYDAFFARLTAGLRPADAAARPASPASVSKP